MPLRPLDILNTAVAVLMLALCGVGAALGRLPLWRELAGLLGVMLVAVWVIGRVARRPRLPWPLAVVVELYPLAFVPLVFSICGPLILALNPAADRGRDGWLIAADRRLFRGVDPTVWLQTFVRPWLTDVMYLAYCAYFFVPLVLAWFVWRRRSLAVLRRYVFVVVLSFYVTYVGYFLVPAKGPRETIAHTVKLQVTPISRGVTDGMNWLERNKNDVFPSGHVAITAICLLLALRESRRLFWGLLPVCLGVFVSTVYCRYHYVVDVIAGLVVALPMPWVGGWVYDRCMGTSAPPRFGR